MRLRLGLGLTLVTLSLAAGCGGGEFSAEAEPGGAAGVDSGEGGDAGVHADSGSHLEAGGDQEAGAEAGADAGADAEAGADAGAEAGADAGADAEAGVEAEAGADAEAGVDAGADADAGPDAGDGGACDVVEWFRDDDGDSYGGSIAVKACVPPGNGAWTTKGGDCNDGNAQVNPGQTGYFDHPYAISSSTLSYDYDCDGEELPSGSLVKGTGQCGLGCSGSGYLPTNPVRSGSGVNSYCGSTYEFTCKPGLVPLTCTDSTNKNAPPILCH